MQQKTAKKNCSTRRLYSGKYNIVEQEPLSKPGEWSCEIFNQKILIHEIE